MVKKTIIILRIVASVALLIVSSILVIDFFRILELSDDFLLVIGSGINITSLSLVLALLATFTVIEIGCVAIKRWRTYLKYGEVMEKNNPYAGYETGRFPGMMNTLVARLLKAETDEDEFVYVVAARTICEHILDTYEWSFQIKSNENLTLRERIERLKRNANSDLPDIFEDIEIIWNISSSCIHGEDILFFEYNDVKEKIANIMDLYEKIGGNKIEVAREEAYKKSIVTDLSDDNIVLQIVYTGVLFNSLTILLFYGIWLIVTRH